MDKTTQAFIDAALHFLEAQEEYAATCGDYVYLTKAALSNLFYAQDELESTGASYQEHIDEMESRDDL